MPSSACQKSALDRKSTRLNSSHTIISYAVFCLKKTHVLINLLAEEFSFRLRRESSRRAAEAPCYPRSDSLQRWTDRPGGPAPPPHDIPRRRHHDHPPAA